MAALSLLLLLASPSPPPTACDGGNDSDVANNDETKMGDDDANDDDDVRKDDRSAGDKAFHNDVESLFDEVNDEERREDTFGRKILDDRSERVGAGLIGVLVVVSLFTPILTGMVLLSKLVVVCLGILCDAGIGFPSGNFGDLMVCCVYSTGN